MYWYWEYQKINNTVKNYISNQYVHRKTFSHATVIISIRYLFTKLFACWNILEVVLLSLIQQNPSQATRKIHCKKNKTAKLSRKGFPLGESLKAHKSRITLRLMLLSSRGFTTFPALLSIVLTSDTLSPRRISWNFGKIPTY